MLLLTLASHINILIFNNNSYYKKFKWNVTYFRNTAVYTSVIINKQTFLFKSILNQFKNYHPYYHCSLPTMICKKCAILPLKKEFRGKLIQRL